MNTADFLRGTEIDILILKKDEFEIGLSLFTKILSTEEQYLRTIMGLYYATNFF